MARYAAEERASVLECGNARRAIDQRRSAAVEGGGASRSVSSVKQPLKCFLRVVHVHVLRLVPVALTQPRSVRVPARRSAAGVAAD